MKMNEVDVIVVICVRLLLHYSKLAFNNVIQQEQQLGYYSNMNEEMSKFINAVALKG